MKKMILISSVLISLMGCEPKPEPVKQPKVEYQKLATQWANNMSFQLHGVECESAVWLSRCSLHLKDYGLISVLCDFEDRDCTYYGD